jgi:hypothetical protein
LRAGSGQASLQSVGEEADKLARIRALALPADLFAEVPSKVLLAFRRRVAAEELHELRRHPAALRLTLLAAFCHVRGREITDALACCRQAAAAYSVSSCRRTTERTNRSRRSGDGGSMPSDRHRSRAATSNRSDRCSSANGALEVPRVPQDDCGDEEIQARSAVLGPLSGLSAACVSQRLDRMSRALC